jgi:hypothetical protein
MLQYGALAPGLFMERAKTLRKAYPLGRGAMVAQQTLDLFILVRIRTPQPG